MEPVLNENYDAIVIGGGLGGLTAAALLAKRGKKVLIIEQSVAVGGCAVTFQRKQYKMEAALHEIDGLGKYDYKRKIFQQLDIFSKVKFLKTEQMYRFISLKDDFIFPEDLDEAIKELTEKFPDEKEGIAKFFRTVIGIRKEVYRLSRIAKLPRFLTLPFFPLIAPRVVYNTYINQTVGNFIDSIISSQRLKLILMANIAYYHDDPYQTSLIYYSAGQGGYYSEGGYFVQGGASQLADSLASIVEDNGGRVLLRTTVSKIIIKDSKAAGVSYYHNNRPKEIKNIFAKALIANNAIDNIATMLPDMEQEKIRKLSANKQLSNSFFNIHIGFKKSPKSIGNNSYSTFISNRNNKAMADIVKNLQNSSYEDRSFTFVDYSQVDSKLAPEGQSVGMISAVDYIANWKNLTDEEYKQKKETVAKIFFKRLESVIPGICNEIGYYDVSTPKTIQRYTLNPDGVVYGFAQTPSQAGLNRIPNISPIENLYLASAWVNPGGGFTGVILSGYFAALEIP